MSRAGDRPTTTRCPAGTLRGLDRGATRVYKGIPFATAGRFEPPRDVRAWEGVLDATTYRAQSPQTSGPLERLLGASSLPMDEDCLHLNVFTPAPGDESTAAAAGASPDGRGRPVLVWIHGGAFLTGGGALPWYDGSRLATRGDVVVVTVNYRLGALGFLGERNSGTLDQVAALRWVARNIAAFGGDPGDVTVFGESAGGSAVVSLSAVPDADGLFRAAWAMSPSLLQLRGPERAAEYEAATLDAAGVRTVGELRALPVVDVLAAQASVVEGDRAGFQCYAPTERTATVPRRFLDAATADSRPLVIGTTRDEMALFTALDESRRPVDEARRDRIFGRRFGDRAAEAIAVYEAHHPGLGLAATTAAMETDEVFRWPAWSLAQRRVEHGAGSTWMYRFDWATPVLGGGLGACHGVDIPFVFDNLGRPGVELFTGAAAERQPVADVFADAVVAFARHGDPGWSAYDATRRATFLVDTECSEADDPDREVRELWAARAARL